MKLLKCVLKKPQSLFLKATAILLPFISFSVFAQDKDAATLTNLATHLSTSVGLMMKIIFTVSIIAGLWLFINALFAIKKHAEMGAQAGQSDHLGKAWVRGFVGIFLLTIPFWLSLSTEAVTGNTVSQLTQISTIQQGVTIKSTD